MLFTGIDGGIKVPEVMSVFGSESETLLKLMLAANGGVPAFWYTSFPWTRSFMMPYPPRITVLPFPFRSYANPTRGWKLFQLPFTQPFGTLIPQVCMPLR